MFAGVVVVVVVVVVFGVVVNENGKASNTNAEQTNRGQVSKFEKSKSVVRMGACALLLHLRTPQLRRLVSSAGHSHSDGT